MELVADGVRKSRLGRGVRASRHVEHDGQKAMSIGLALPDRDSLLGGHNRGGIGLSERKLHGENAPEVSLGLAQRTWSQILCGDDVFHAMIMHLHKDISSGTIAECCTGSPARKKLPTTSPQNIVLHCAALHPNEITVGYYNKYRQAPFSLIGCVCSIRKT